MLRDYNIEWLEKRIWIPASAFGWLPAVVGTGAAVTADVEFDAAAGPNGRGRLETADAAGNYEFPGASLGAGMPLYAEVNALGVTGFLMNTAGDEVNYLGLIPYDLDITKQVRMRVWWCTDSTDSADTVDWIVRFARFSGDDSDAIASPSTGLDTTIAQDNVLGTTAVRPQATSFGIINRNTFAQDDALWALEVEMDAKAAGLAEDLWFLGLEVRYTPRKTAGPRRNILGGRRLAQPLGVQLAATQEGL